VCGENVRETPIVPSSTNASRKRKRLDSVSSKLWHCRLDHISRGSCQSELEGGCLRGGEAGPALR
jgi:hypothetical protein